MSRINGRKLGVWSLRLDAIYCAILGAAVAVSAPSLAAVIALPQPLITAAGIAVALWAGLVLWMVVKLRIRSALRMVMGVNVLAAILVALCATAAGSLLAGAAVLAIAVDVALFAASQAIALRTLPAGPVTAAA